MLRFIDGFDFYATADLTKRYNIAGGTFSVVSGAGRFGSGALFNGHGGGNERVVRFFDSQPTWIVGFSYKFDTAGFPNTICSLQDSGNAQVELKMNSSNQLGVYRNGTLIGTSGATSLLSNTFYYIEWKVTISTSIAANSCKVRIGGVDEVVLPTGSNTDGQATGIANRVLLWYDYFANSNTYDDYYVCDGTGTVNNDFLGDQRVETIRPNGAGAHTQFAFVGAATNWQAVSESLEDGDTSYVSSATIGQLDTYTFADLANAPTSISGVQVTLINRKDDAGSRFSAVVVRSGATDYVGPTFSVVDSYVFSSTIFSTDPFTSSAWTGSGVNAMEAGVKLVG